MKRLLLLTLLVGLLGGCWFLDIGKIPFYYPEWVVLGRYVEQTSNPYPSAWTFRKYDIFFEYQDPLVEDSEHTVTVVFDRGNADVVDAGDVFIISCTSEDAAIITRLTEKTVSVEDISLRLPINGSGTFVKSWW